MIKILQAEARKDILSKESIFGLSTYAATIASIGAIVTSVFGLPSGWVLIALCGLFTSMNISLDEVKYKLQLVPLFLMKTVLLFWLAYTSSSGVAIVNESLDGSLKFSNVAAQVEEAPEPTVALSVERPEHMEIPSKPSPREESTKQSPWRVRF